MDNKSEIMNMMLEMEYIPVKCEEAINKNEYMKLPVSQLASLGGILANLPASARTITSTVNASGLYQVTLPAGASHLATLKDGSAMIGAAFDAKNNLIGQAKITDAKDVIQSTVVPIDPMTLAIAAMLMNIEAKLDDIKETQKDIYDFLKMKEESQLKGSLDTLSEIINSYKHHFENKTFVEGNYVIVRNINRDAKSSIEFYTKQIKNELSKQKLIHSEADIKKQTQNIKELFKNYQLSLYIYSFSSFVEVLLLKDYKSESLQDRIFTISEYNHKYKHLYTECYNILEEYSSTSIESHMLKGLSKLTSSSGKALAKVPLISKSSLDESLIEAGNKLSDFKQEHNQKHLNKMIDINDAGVLLFINNINTIDYLYNQPMQLLIDKNEVYVRCTN